MKEPCKSKICPSRVPDSQTHAVTRVRGQTKQITVVRRGRGC